MIGLRVYELKQDKDRDVRENTVLTNVSDEVLKLSVMLNKMNSLEIPNDGETNGSGQGIATTRDDPELDSTFDKTLDTTNSDGSDTIIETLLTAEESERQSVGVEKAEEMKEESLAAKEIVQQSKSSEQPSMVKEQEPQNITQENYEEEW